MVKFSFKNLVVVDSSLVANEFIVNFKTFFLPNLKRMKVIVPIEKKLFIE